MQKLKTFFDHTHKLLLILAIFASVVVYATKMDVRVNDNSAMMMRYELHNENLHEKTDARLLELRDMMLTNLVITRALEAQLRRP